MMRSATVPIVAVVTFLAATAAAAVADTILPSSYLKDSWVPNVNEASIPLPTDGGRMTIVGTAAASGKVGDVVVDGVTIDQSTNVTDGSPIPPAVGQWAFDYVFVQPNPTVAGEPVWIKFHSRDPKWDKVSSANITVASDSDGSTLVKGTFATGSSLLGGLYVSYVAATQTFASIVVHAQNNGTSPVSVTGLTVNGKSVANVATTIAAGAHVAWEARLDKPSSRGSPYTVVIDCANGPSAVAGGRLVVPFFPIEAWPKSKECGYPGANDTNYKLLRQANIDTFGPISSNSGGENDCGIAGSQLVNVVAPQYDFWVLPSADKQTPVHVTNNSRVAAFFLSDEPDDNIGQRLRQIMAQTTSLWEQYPWSNTYAGGKTSRMAAPFSVVDIKGIDMYIAGCAPHVTSWGTAPQPIVSYQYSKANRLNHMPGVTWPYYQALDDGWDAHALGFHDRQPYPNEIAVQAFGAVAAGGKGLMMFQSMLYEQDFGPTGPRWQAIALLNCQFGAVREILRLGDPVGEVTVSMTSDSSSSDSVIAEAIASPVDSAIVVVVANTANSGGYSDLSCTLDMAQHWKFTATSISTLSFPTPGVMPSGAAFELVDTFEVVGGKVVDAPGATVSGGAISITGIELGTDFGASVTSPIGRMFVLASDKGTRSRVSSTLATCGSMSL